METELTWRLQTLIDFDEQGDRASAITALDDIYNDHSINTIKAASKPLSKSQKSALTKIVTARKRGIEKAQELLDLEAWGEFKVGDQVTIKSQLLARQIISRGRVRIGVSSCGKLWRRKGQAMEIVGSGKVRGSRRLRYVNARNVGADVGTIEICRYPSLIGVELIVDSLCYPYLACTRARSGTFASGLLAGELELSPIIYDLCHNASI